MFDNYYFYHTLFEIFEYSIVKCIHRWSQDFTSDAAHLIYLILYIKYIHVYRVALWGWQRIIIENICGVPKSMFKIFVQLTKIMKCDKVLY